LLAQAEVLSDQIGAAAKEGEERGGKQREELEHGLP
jgi:hypothetical protein